MKKLTIKTLTIISLVWAADFVSKFVAVKYLSAGQSVSLPGNFLQFRLVYNTGGVFGIFQGNAIVFHILTGIAIIFLMVYYLKSPYIDKYFNMAVSFVLGGAIGNFTDRFFRHGVVDFIDMGFNTLRWPTYNVADIFISAGGVLMIMSFYIYEKEQNKKILKENS